MNNPFKKKGASLSSKLKVALTNLSVDVFGYQKIVISNFLKNSERISVQLGIPKGQLYIRVFKKNQSICAILYRQNKALYALKIEDLARFFVDPGTASLESTHQKITKGIIEYLTVFSKSNTIDLGSVRIWIYSDDETIQVYGFQNNEFVNSITFDSLIKYFK